MKSSCKESNTNDCSECSELAKLVNEDIKNREEQRIATQQSKKKCDFYDSPLLEILNTPLRTGCGSHSQSHNLKIIPFTLLKMRKKKMLLKAQQIRIPFRILLIKNFKLIQLKETAASAFVQKSERLPSSLVVMQPFVRTAPFASATMSENALPAKL